MPLVLKLKVFSIHSRLSLAQTDLSEFDHSLLAVTDGGSVDECDRLSQLSWLLGAL